MAKCNCSTTILAQQAEIEVLKMAHSGGRFVAIALLRKLGGHAVLGQEEMILADTELPELHQHTQDDGSIELYLEQPGEPSVDELREMLTNRFEQR